MGRYKGAHGLHSFSHIKAVVIDRNVAKPEGYWYPYSKEKTMLLSRILDTLFGPGSFKLPRVVPLAVKLESMAKKNRL
jgi:hypothetical protein